jgi:3-phosphoglycerate kinase
MKMVGLKFYKRNMRKAPLRGKTVLVRVDYNVPMKDGKIMDDFRIRASLPTIKKLLKDNCKVVLISHLGRPEGMSNSEFSLEPVAQRLAKLVDRQVLFVDDCVGVKVRMAVKRAPKNCLMVLENLRFHAGEEANDAVFAQAIAKDSGAQYFIQDGFGVVHRAHASTEAITRFLPSVAGLLLEKEWLSIMNAIKKPRRPLVAVLGGAKVSDKIELIDEFVKVADQIVVGGAMANTFLAEAGFEMGASRKEVDEKAIIDKIYKDVDRKVGSQYSDSFLVLPSDGAVAEASDSTENRQEKMVGSFDKTDSMFDIGQHSIKRFEEAIHRANTVIWNGTMGMAENKIFRLGSAKIAQAIIDSKADSIIGGGDTADFVLDWDKKHGESFSHISTGGGASLELMAGKKLPGIEALIDS